MNERDESERLQAEIAEAYLDIMGEVTAALGHATLERPAELNPPISRLIRAIESREREQTLALLEALRADLEAAIESLSWGEAMTWIGRTKTRIAAYEAAHALQVAHEEVKG